MRAFLLCAFLGGALAAMPPTQPTWTDDGKYPPREPHDVTAPSQIWYEELCPQKNANSAFGSEAPLACPPNSGNPDMLAPPPPPQQFWNNRQVPTLAPAPPDQGSLALPGLAPPEMHAEFFPYHEENTHSGIVDRMVMHSAAPCNSFADDGSLVERDCTLELTKHTFTGNVVTVPPRTFNGRNVLSVPSDITHQNMD